MSYRYPTLIEISYKIVRWQGRPVRLVRIQNEPAGPSAFFSEGSLPAEDSNADALNHILAELPGTPPQDGIPTYIPVAPLFSAVHTPSVAE